MPGETVCYSPGPNDVAIALHHRVPHAALQRFLREKRRVNAAIHNPCAPLAGHRTHLVPAQSIAGMHADADDVSRLNALGRNLLQRLIDQNGVSHRRRRGSRQNKQPTRRNDSRAKRIIAGIHKKNAHRA